jgi:hypothetical protein
LTSHILFVLNCSPEGGDAASKVGSEVDDDASDGEDGAASDGGDGAASDADALD